MDRIFYDIIDTNILKLFTNPTLFFPSNKYDIKTNIDSIIKFFIYISLIIILLTNNWKLVIVIIIFSLILKIFTYKSISLNNEIIKTNDIRLKCRKTTVDNPTGNVLLYTPDNELDYNLCPLQETEMDNNIKYNFYFDSKDLFQKKNNMRPFITMPSQSHPNDIDKFTSYLYNFKGSTCKTGAVNCMFNEDLRYHKNEFLSK
jgi:hypothetical protein